MRQLVLILLVLISLSASAQYRTVQIPVSGDTAENNDVLQRKNNVWVPRTLAQLASDLGVVGGGGSFDTTTIYDELDERVRYSDTAMILLAYRNALLARLLISDTAGMLGAYQAAYLARIRWTDTTTLFADYRNALNARIKYTDSASMLAAYRTGLLSRVLYTDTADMLADYRDAINAFGSSDNFIQNQSAVVQDAEITIAGPIRVGTNMAMDGRVRMILKDNTSPSNESFSAFLLKADNDIGDLNMASGVVVKHSDDYNRTGGYAGTLQVYKEAKGLGGLVLGDNNFVRADTMTVNNYAPTVDDIANGFVGIELGPLQPKSEKFRWNNRGDAIFGWNNIRNYVASQTGTIVTDPVNSFFATDVGKWFVWSTQDAGGKARFADRITGYTDANHITVETSRTIAAQGGRVAEAWAYVDTIGNARFRITHVDSLRIGTDAAYYRFVPSGASLSLIRVGASSPDTLFDISGTSRFLTGRDIELKGSHYSKILFKNSTTDLFSIVPDATQTFVRQHTNVPINFSVNAANTFSLTSTASRSFVPLVLGTTGTPAPIGHFDVYNSAKQNSVYIDNTRAATSVNRGLLLDVTATNTADNIGLYVTVNGSPTDKGIVIPASSGNGAGDFAISSETTAKSVFAGKVSVGTLTAVPSYAAMTVNNTSASSAIQFKIGDSEKGLFGIANATNDLATGSANSDIVFRNVAAGKNILFATGTAGDTRMRINETTGFVTIGTAAGTSKLTVEGSFATPITTTAKTTAYTAAATDYTITGDATSAGFNVTLPTAVGIAGRIYTIKKIDASGNAVTVATTSSQTIDAATTYALGTQYKYVTVQSNNANWIVIGNN